MSEEKELVVVDGAGQVALGAYLVALTLTIVIIIWQTVPSCDVAGFVVSRLAPTQVLTTGSEQVRITGEGFERGLTVRVGDKTVQSSVISPFEIVVTTPPLAVGRASVTVTQEGFPSTDVPGGLEYIRTGPIVTGVVPAHALAEGNETLRLIGDRFRPGATVKIGTLGVATAQFVNASELTVRTAKHAVGVVPIVITQGAESVTLDGHLQFVTARTPAPAPAAMQINTIEPATSRSAGGDAVTITGSGFTRDMTVRFGGVPARSVLVDGSRFITAVTPMHAPGPVSVIVGNDQAVNALDGRFSYVCPAPPDRSMVLLILLAGALGGLVHALRSFFWYAGEQKLVLNWVPMYLVLPFSSSALGFVFYLVVRAGLYQPTAGTSYLLVGLATLVGMFSVQAAGKLKDIAEGIFSKASQGANSAPPADPANPAPAVSGITPAFGPVTGGNLVTIVGTGFTAKSVVRFDKTTCTKTTHVDATTLQVVVPAGAAVGVVDVAVKIGTKETVKPKAYTYVTPTGKIDAVTPNSGPIAGGTAVTITGEKFAGNVLVFFGNAPGASPKVVDASTIEVVTPAHAAGRVDVRVDAGTDVIAVVPGAFEYRP